MSDKPQRVSGRRGRRRAAHAAAAVAAPSLLTAACASGNPASSGPTGSSAANNSGSTASKTGNSKLPMLPIAICCTWGTTWSLNPYAANSVGIQNDFVYLRLAVQDAPSITKFTPQLASSWKVTPSAVTVNLRPGLKWQNGTPVTSQDLYDTVLLDGMNGTGFWNDISNVSAPNSSQVVFTLAKGEPTALALFDILTDINVYPAATYGRFITPNLKADEVAYFTKDDTDPSAAQKMPQYKAIENAYTNLAKFNPSSIMGDGPFILGNITTSQAVLTKSNSFYDASDVHIGGIDYLNGTTNQIIYPQMLSGQAAFSNVYLPPSIVTRWKSTSDANVALPLAFGFVMEFNDHDYPLNLTPVRQALAYVVPRSDMTGFTYGTTDAGGTTEAHPDGLAPNVEDQYLTPSQAASLNTYPINTAKATSLLESVGFKKSGGQWVTAKGQPFTLSMLLNSATSDIETSFESAAKALNAFGIKTTINATEGTIQGADASKGDFDVSQQFIGGYNPLLMFDSMLGTDGNNFTTLGNYAGDRGMGFGPTTDVPGLGTVNVAQTITHEAHTTGPGAEMDQLTWDWARMVNQQVPYLWYATKVYQFSFSTANFADWPPMNSQHTSPLWNMISSNTNAGLVVALEDGYIRPKS